MSIICDFCSDVPVVARYHADNILVIATDGNTTFTQESLGDWAACRVCEALIDAGHWDMLLDRAVEQFYIVNPEVASMPKSIVRDYLSNMYATLRTASFHKVRL